MGHTHTHTIAKHRQTLVKNEFCPCLRSNTCRKINMSFAAQKQSKPTGGGLSMKFCCRICMHSSGYQFCVFAIPAGTFCLRQRYF